MQIILAVFYILVGTCSIFPFKKVLKILEEKHLIEEEDDNILMYNIMGVTK